MNFIEKWHKGIADRDITSLDDLLHDDVVLYSPVLYAPQEGKELVTMYLTAALNVIANEDFKYVKEIYNDRLVCLEFETQMDDTYVNGIDIISLNEEGKIVEFKVMVRPEKALGTLKQKMFEYLLTLG